MKNKYSRQDHFMDLLLNYLSFAVSASGGLAFLLICAISFGPPGLGVVSQVMALYVVGGQVAVCGIQFSALRTASDPTIEDADKASRIWAALWTAAIWGGAIGIVGLSVSDVVGEILESVSVAEGWMYASFALGIFAINKTAASALNGLNCMRRFAAQTALRPLGLAVAAIGLVTGGADAAVVCLAFLIAESIVLLFLLIQLVTVLGWPQNTSLSIYQMRQHLFFGLRGIWSGLAYELNVRLDVLMVGFFMTDGKVGLYALVAQIAEGFFNLVIVLRNQLAPLIARHLSMKNYMAVRNLALVLVSIAVPLAAFLAIVGLFFYTPVVSFILPDQGFEAGVWLLAILLLGIVLNTWLIPMDTILLTSGNPGFYSLTMISAVITNATANLILVPIWGLPGAATATCIATVLSGLYLTATVRLRLGFWLIPSHPNNFFKAIKGTLY